MYKVVLTLVLLIILSNGYAQMCEQRASPEDVKKMNALIGEWKGEFTDSGTTRAISMKFYIQDEALKAEVTNRFILTASEIADVSLCSTNKFHFFGSRINSEVFTYNARLINGELIGNYKIGNNCSTENLTSFKLTKTSN